MLVIRKKEKSDPVTFTQPFRGHDITLTVRPYDKDEIRKLEKKHTTFVFGVNPKTKQLERVPIVNAEEFGKDIIDYLVVDFSGVGMSPEQPLEVTRENKLQLLSLEPDEGEDTLSEVVQRKARELSEVIAVEEKERIKNSSGASGTD